MPEEFSAIPIMFSA
jgi:dynein heavy chain